MITEREKKTLTEIGAQLAVTFRSKGISEPTPEQINEAFIEQCKRNIELSQSALYGYNLETGRNMQTEQEAIVTGLVTDVYNKIRGAQ